MEKIGSTISSLLIILLLVFLTSSGCKKCSRCEDLPNGVTQLQGEWEWIYTQRQFISEDGALYDDTIKREETNISATMNISSDGCLQYTINECEYLACLDVYKHRVEEDTIPWYKCREMIWMTLEGVDLSTTVRVQVQGSNCNEMDSLHGITIPYNKENRYVPTPPSSFSGLELNGHSNHFIRVR